VRKNLPYILFALIAGGVLWYFYQQRPATQASAPPDLSRELMGNTSGKDSGGSAGPPAVNQPSTPTPVTAKFHPIPVDLPVGGFKRPKAA
jgi:hypothetical protein